MVKRQVKQGLSIDGEMTIYRAAELREMLLPALLSSTAIEIDLSGVSEIDASGLQLMLAAKIDSMQRDIELSFTGHSTAVQAVLDLTDLSSFFGDPVVITCTDNPRTVS